MQERNSGLTCPKCHRPIEGDEPYICCAGVRLQWRCRDCSKLSEGFAFPYGMCPHCGGRLEIAETRPIEGGDYAAVRAAFEIELGGMAFYERASAQAAEPVMRELFGKLADMEMEHMETLARRYHADIPDKPIEFSIDRAAIFAGIRNDPSDPGNLLRIAIAFEERAVEFFKTHAGRAAQGSVERQLYLELAAEERDHVALLTTEYNRWQAGGPGMLQV